MVEANYQDAPFYKRRPCACCCGACLFILFLIIIIIIILAFTVFKAKKAQIHVQDVELQNFQASLVSSGLIPKPSVNITLALSISVYNPNRASFKYSNSSADMLYHGDVVGIVPIPAGDIGSQDTKLINTTMDVLADKLLSNSHLLGDFTSGSLPFTVTTEISGRIKVLGFIKHHVDISSQCSLSISISNQSISDTDCRDKVKL